MHTNICCEKFCHVKMVLTTGKRLLLFLLIKALGWLSGLLIMFSRFGKSKNSRLKSDVSHKTNTVNAWQTFEKCMSIHS